jgi:biotin carboxyl carrier protein
MPTPTEINQESVDAVLRAVNRLRYFEGTEEHFWRALTEVFTRMCDGMAGCALKVVPAEGLQRFQQKTYWPDLREVSPLFENEEDRINRLLEIILEEGFGHASILDDRGKEKGGFAGVRLQTGDASRPGIFFLYRDPWSADWLRQVQLYLRLFADTPFVFFSRQRDDRQDGGMEAFADTLEILAIFNRQRRFLASCMCLVNELAERLASDEVDLGWVQSKYIKLRAVSHTSKFEKRTDARKELEYLMEEAYDQDGTVSWPSLSGATTINRQHGTFARLKGLDSVLSTVIRIDGEPMGVLTVQRSRGYPFTEAERQKLQLISSQVGRRLADLHRTDRWFGSRLALATRDGLALLLGPEHTWIKLGSLALAGAFAFLCFVPWPYRVQANFSLKADQLAYVTTPFEGYIKEVPFRLGDTVEAGDVVVALDDQELVLEEMEAMANRERFENETRQAQRERRMVELAAARSRVDQANAQAEIIRRRIALTRIRAPFAAAIVEGELKNRIGSPVEKGEVLLRLASLDDLYAELSIPEWAIDEVSPDSQGALSFTSRPGMKFPFRVVRIIPATQTTQQGNAFLAEVVIDAPDEDWWRPGMSGLAKIDAGKRSLLWIWTHRAIDFLKLRFWW